MTGSREMEDQWGRTIDYLRLSVTASCNLGCLYCRLPGCSPLQQEPLTDEEIMEHVMEEARMPDVEYRKDGSV